MRKTSASTPCFISRGIPHSSNREHWRRCPRLHWFLLFLLAALAVSVGGQDLKPLPASALADRAQRALREQWFLRGRSSPGQSGAAQRYRAYLQKMRMRSARPAMAQKLGRDASPAALLWSSLGPAPLASDASGVGELVCAIGLWRRDRWAAPHQPRRMPPCARKYSRGHALMAFLPEHR